MDRPRVVTGEELANPSEEQSAGMQRGQAFAHEGVWAGFATFPAGASTGWHHHAGYATYAYITSGVMTVESGPGGRDVVEVHEGDFVHIPAGLIHRESVSADGAGGAVVRVGGTGATVVNVEGPEPAG